jgi:hypothetical protein
MTLSSIMESLKMLFVPKYTDKKVDAINLETQKLLADAAKTAARYNRLLKKNGVTMRIAIATGHGDRK